MANALFPPKLAVVHAVNGEFDPALLDLELHPERWPEAGTPHAHSGHVSLKPRRKPAAPEAAETDRMAGAQNAIEPRQP